MTADHLRGRIRVALGVVIAGLVVSGVTAVPLEWELGLLARLAGSESGSLGRWILTVSDGLRDTYSRHPFMAYGTDWLAFAHVVIAIAFIGPWLDPVRNAWVVTVGIIACVLVVPMAMIFGSVRAIPAGWIAIDCSFGVVGLLPLVLARRWTQALSTLGSQGA